MSEIVPEYGGCPWPTAKSCLTEEWLASEGPLRDRALALASSTLERLTGYRVGNCPITVRPCRQACNCQSPYYLGRVFDPQVYAGRWFNNVCGNPSCKPMCEVVLPAPIGRIDEVKIDGVTLAPSEYQVQNDRYLVYVGIEDTCPFPATQDLSKPDTEEGTFSVTYLNAYPVDELGAQAVTILALEFLKACKGGKCALPKNVREVARNGVSFTIEAGLFPDGLTNIKQVDGYIEMWRPPGSPTQPPRIYSPGMNRPRVVRG